MIRFAHLRPSLSPLSLPAFHSNDKNSKINRARRRMLEDRGEGEEEEMERATDRHSIEARMMNDLLSDMGLPSRQRRAGEGKRRRSRDAGEEKDENDSDDASVSSVRSSASSAPVGGPKLSPRVRIGSSASGNSANDLMTKMAGRLARVEMTNKRLKDEASKKDKLLERQHKVRTCDSRRMRPHDCVAKRRLTNRSPLSSRFAPRARRSAS